MTDVRLDLPKPEIRGVGRVLYRCFTCGEMAEPEECVIRDGKSHHIECPTEGDKDGR